MMRDGLLLNIKVLFYRVSQRLTRLRGVVPARVLLVCSVLGACLFFPALANADKGVTETEIRIGTILPLDGRSRALGQKMLLGMQAGFKDTVIDGKTLQLITQNDSGNPAKTVSATRRIISEDVMLLLGNVGNPSSEQAMALLAENNIPSIVFLSGTSLSDSSLQVVNYRASYRLETASVINRALEAGVKPAEVCAYVENNDYGVAGLLGMRKSLEGKAGTEDILAALDAALVKTEDKPLLNDTGPVGTYTRDTFRAREGYNSLKKWEESTGFDCKLVVTVGAYDPVAYFIAYAASKGENWVYSAVSSTGADNLLTTLKRFDVTDRVLMTQVLPPLDSDLTIVSEARQALGDDFGYVTMNGYISARLLVHGLEQLVSKGRAITQENLLKEFRGQSFQLWGLHLDFKKDGEQFDFITTNRIFHDEWALADESIWQGWYK